MSSISTHKEDSDTAEGLETWSRHWNNLREQQMPLSKVGVQQRKHMLHNGLPPVYTQLTNFSDGISTRSGRLILRW